jgi:two-component system response regulator DesR
LGIAMAAALITPLTQPEPFYWMPGVLVSIIVGLANIFFAEQGRKNAELKLGQAEIKRLARVAERERIARDLHDVLGHTLSMIAVKSELAEKLVERDPDRARDEIHSMGESARRALAEVREAISGYQRQSLTDSLEHVRLSLRAADIEPQIDVEEAIDIAPRTEGMLALVIREAVTNVIRHSNARRWRRADPHGRQRHPGYARAHRVARRYPEGRLQRPLEPAGTHPAGSGMIRIVLAEDQTLLLGALASLLDLEEDIEIAGRAADGDEARALVENERPDLVLTDIEMPGSTGLDLAEWVRSHAPETAVAILTTFARPGYLRRALEAGVRGYLLKETQAEKLADSIRRIHAGQRVIDPELALTAFDSSDPLTDRERQVLKLAGEGLGNAEIGRRMHLADGTVRNYLSEAIGKLQADNRIEAYRIARDQGWL